MSDVANNAELSVCAVVPVYKHQNQLAEIVAELCANKLSVFLVDDGNDAECAAAIEKLQSDSVQIIKNSVNLGKGAAIKVGFLEARKLDYTHAVQIDADGQHNTADLGRFLSAMYKHPQALINGCPVFDESIPAARYFGRYLTHVLVWINTVSFQVRDSMCGFRIYPLEKSCELMNTARVGNRMDFDTSFIVHWCWRGYDIQQLDTRVIYHEGGHSNFRMLKDNALISRMHLGLFFGMLARSPRLLARKWQKQ